MVLRATSHEPRATSHGFFHGDTHNRYMRHGFANCELRTATGGLRMAFFPNRILRDSHNGTPATAVRFGSHPALPVGQCLVGQKGFQDVPYESGPVDRLLTATGGLRPANGVFSEQHFTGFPQWDALSGRPLRYRI